MHKSTGKIVYDPYRGKLKKKPHWWCVVEVDTEITRYYRWWIQNKYHVKGLCQPSWDAHISVIRGEKPKPELMHLWKKYHGQVIEFEYEHNPRKTGERDHHIDGDGHYWFVDIKCEQLTNIRKELMLPYDWSLHLTVGRTWF